MNEDLKENELQESLLKRVEIQELAARRFGFYWEQIDQLIEQIQSECLEVKEALEHGDRKHLQEEIGDLIQAAVSVAVFCDLDPEETLAKSIEKFQNRYDKLVALAKADGHDHLRGHTFEQMMHYWKLVK